jgi:integrase
VALSITSGDCLVSDLIEAFRAQTEVRKDIKAITKARIGTAVSNLLKTWPELPRMKPHTLTATNIANWARRFKTEGTSFTPPGSKTVIRGNSSSSVNKAIDVLRGIMDIAVDRGAISANPVPKKSNGERIKKKVEKKTIDLPSTADFHRLLAAMETNGARGGWGREAADFCRFLAFSGCRVGEVAQITWSCVDWNRKQIHLPGYKTETSDRYIPILPDLDVLLRALIERRKSAARFAVDGKPYLAPTDTIFRIKEAQKTIDRAAAVTGIKRVTHHDLRDMFGTVCIESGVDIPTVSRWLGHKDGGALLLKTYNHLRQEHSQTQAAKVSFGGVV